MNKTKRCLTILYYTIKFYFDKNMPRDKYNFKTKICNAICYAEWLYEDNYCKERNVK